MAKAKNAAGRQKATPSGLTGNPGDDLLEKDDITAVFSSKDVHLEKGDHKACFHCHDGNPPQSQNTMSVVEYIDGKVAASDRVSIEDGKNAIRALLKDGYEIIHPETGKDDD